MRHAPHLVAQHGEVEVRDPLDAAAAAVMAPCMGLVPVLQLILGGQCLATDQLLPAGTGKANCHGLELFKCRC